MKKISILIIVMFLTVLVGQTKAQAPKFNINETTKLITYSEVVQTTGVPVELFNRCIENFINKFYANPTGATSVRDKETGLIECKHQFKIYNVDKEGKLDMNKSAYVVAYVLTINFKDGRYKYTIDKFNVKAASALPLEKWINDPIHDAHLKQVDEFSKDLIKQLKKGMIKAAEVKKEEW